MESSCGNEGNHREELLDGMSVLGKKLPFWSISHQPQYTAPGLHFVARAERSLGLGEAAGEAEMADVKAKRMRAESFMVAR